MMECQPVWNIYFFGSLVLMRFFGQTTQSEAFCSQTIDGVKRFGANCNFRCHCLNRAEQCNTETGACTSGCDFEWAGPRCQFRNIALGSYNSRHSDNKNPERFSNLANDQSTTTCSYTDYATPRKQRSFSPWWAVWFPEDVTLSEFVFMTEDSYLEYFTGFNVTVQQGISESEHVSKTYHSGELCYQHDSSTPPNTTVYVKCTRNLVGNQLRIQLANISSQLVLCDFRVYGGCDDGIYGEHCSRICSENCRDTNCTKENGTCIDGCTSGFTGDNCTKECEDGMYGDGCENNCSRNCGRPCNKVNGRCVACKAGWKGDNCTTGCDDGIYGENCSRVCSENCRDTNCTKENGTCIEGCTAGFTGDNCTKECEDGMYGDGCENSCSANCDGPCNNVNGTCVACKAGWKGDNCTTECEEGTYGDGCKNNCSAYCDDPCNKVNGKCSSCKAGWKGDKCIAEVSQSFPVAVVVGGASGAVVFAALVCVSVFCLRKRSQNQRSTLYKSTKESILSPAVTTDEEDVKRRMKNENRRNVYCNALEFEERLRHPEDERIPRDLEENECEYVNDKTMVCTKTEHEVLISRLKDYVNIGLADKTYFDDQFKKIPYGMQYPATVATNPKNIGKNKYKSMYAYDHSRVVLKKQSQDGSDYINATNIMGYSCENSYIAAQGPIQTTLDDFWRMIWENNIRTIIMATNLSEEGKMKCLQYWPEISQTAQYGNLNIEMESEDIFTELVVRRLKVSHEGKPEKQRTVTQFHYRAWPDKGVPRCTSSLLHFWYQVRKQDAKKAVPWLVHCSAGVGRTGTFIALDILYEEGTDKGSIDIYQCVSTLREQRVNMVQTKEQYKFLHSIMVEALVLAWKPIIVDQFASVYDKLREVDQRTGKTQLLLQYESLNDAPEVVNEQGKQEDLYSSAKRCQNRDKNRYDNILASNEFRPFLCSRVSGCTDYINAIYIPGYRRKHAYIITQTPLMTTAVDCCRLLIEEEVKFIVTFEDSDGQEVGEYLPARGGVNIGPFTTTFVSEEDKRHSLQRKFEVKFESQKHSVTQLIFKHWLPLKLTPSNANEMLYFLEEIERLQRLTENKPILIQCLNGAERSGLVAVLLNILERVRFDNEVSILQVVRQLKVRRQQIIPNFEQYKFCHEVLLSHIQSNSAYANM